MESGEGIERRRSAGRKVDDNRGVESGEGIERLYQSARLLLAMYKWNPVKELKESINHRLIRGLRELWNPVKELKVVSLLILDTTELRMWNPVKELKVQEDLMRLLAPGISVESGEGIES